MKWLEIPEKNLVKGTIQLVKLSGHTFCLVFERDRWVAFSNKCPHAGAPLVQGWCEAGKVVCSYHRRRFDLRTGRGDEGQGDFITIYPTKEEGGKWYVRFKDSLFERLFSS